VVISIQGWRHAWVKWNEEVGRPHFTTTGGEWGLHKYRRKFRFIKWFRGEYLVLVWLVFPQKKVHFFVIPLFFVISSV
jgi:hypothetical protein